jgi:hypothetical protein
MSAQCSPSRLGSKFRFLCSTQVINGEVFQVLDRLAEELDKMGYEHLRHSQTDFHAPEPKPQPAYPLLARKGHC